MSKQWRQFVGVNPIQAIISGASAAEMSLATVFHVVVQCLASLISDGTEKTKADAQESIASLVESSDAVDESNREMAEKFVAGVAELAPQLVDKLAADFNNALASGAGTTVDDIADIGRDIVADVENVLDGGSSAVLSESAPTILALLELVGGTISPGMEEAAAFVKEMSHGMDEFLAGLMSPDEFLAAMTGGERVEEQ